MEGPAVVALEPGADLGMLARGVVVQDRCLWLSATDRARLAAIVAGRNSPQKHGWRAQIVLRRLLACEKPSTGRRKTGLLC